MQRYLIYTIFLSFILLTACSRRPSYVLSEEKMTDVLYDIQLAQAIFKTNSDFTSDDRKDRLVEGILEKHNISQADLDSSLIWYSDNINIYVDINDEVAERLKTDYDTIVARRNHLMKNVRDWSNYIIPPYFYLTESSPLIAFSIDSVKRKEIDLKYFNIAFDVQGVNKYQDVEATIYYTYKDSLIRDRYSIDENTSFFLKKPELADSLLKEISGYIYMKNKIEGTNSNVLFYNVSYSDSTLLDINRAISPRVKESSTIKRVKSGIKLDKSVPKESDRALDKKENKPQDKDDIPVLSKDDVERNPILKRSRNSERLKKD